MQRFTSSLSLLVAVSGVVVRQPSRWLTKEQRSQWPPRNPIQVVHVAGCWSRPGLIHSTRCMDYLTETCGPDRSINGYCSSYRRWVKSKCERGREKACKHMEALGLKLDEPREEAMETADVEASESQAEIAPESDDDFAVDDNDEMAKEEMEEPLPWAAPAAAPEAPPDAVLSPSPATAGAQTTGAPAPMDSVPPRAPLGLSPSEPQDGTPSEPQDGAQSGPLGVGGSHLPSNGYDEHSDWMVTHVDGKTATRDWGKEWPSSSRSEEATTEKICKEQPDLDWCRRFLRYRLR